MFKLGLDVAEVTGSWYGFAVPLYLGAERPLGRHFSATVDVTSSIGFRRKPQLAELSGSLGVRYYYNQARRQRLGKPTQRLGGTYLQAQFTNTFNRTGLWTYPTEGPAYFSHQPSAELFWGWQRRFGRYGFVDAAAGLRLLPNWSYRNSPEPRYRWQPEIGLRVRAGLAF
ncbi:hypothetical protein ASU33_01925 [Solirubrum puertoriconensis]|uniref:Uncharacterized protein n=2 Tax=Solirubrum puertoriconensis TaxID=1751427 RepID=A0A9X0HHT1_SOLP1|nr:hypothetical protein ASU33_01925 [Solirubrum puertoriconensis]